MPSLGAALVRRGHEVVHFSVRVGARRDRSNDGVEVVRLRRRFEDRTSGTRRTSAGGCCRGWRGERFDAVHSLGRHDALASIRASRLRRDGRRTVITDLGIPDPVWWRTQGRLRGPRGGQRWSGGSMSTAPCPQTAVAASLPTTDDPTASSSPVASTSATSCRPPEREPRPTILFSGAITEPRKGVAGAARGAAADRRARAGRAAVAERPWRCVGVAGAAPPAVRVTRVAALGVGEADRQHERYGRAWVTCLPSTHDSFGMALVESLACGTPLVTTTSGAPQELVQRGCHRRAVRSARSSRRSPTPACGRSRWRASRRRRARAARAPSGYDWDLALAPLCERLYESGP